MAAHPPCPPEELRWSIAAARLVLPPEIHVQAPPNLSDDLAPCSTPGIDDWGGVSPVTADHVNPERAWPALDVLRAATEAAGHTLAPRLTIYPAFALDPERWLDPALRFPVLDAADAEGLAREDRWCSGGEQPPPAARRAGDRRPRTGRPAARGRRRGGRGAGRGGARPGGRRATRSSPCSRPGGPRCGRWPRWPTSSGRGGTATTVTFVANRNINYTNVCTFKCRFCAFSKGPLSLNLRGAPYLLDLDEITRRVVEAEAVGATEVCLQGGIHPKFDGDYYVDVLRAVRAGVRAHPHPRLHRPGGDRGGPPLGRAAGRLPGAAEGGRAARPCRARRPRSSTTRCGPCSARTRSTPSSGWRPTAPPTRSACAPTSPSCSAPSSSRSAGPGTWCAPGPCSGRPAGSPSSCPCPSSTWPPPSTCSAGPAGARPSARRCSCTPWAASPTAGPSTTSRSAG